MVGTRRTCDIEYEGRAATIRSCPDGVSSSACVLLGQPQELAAQALAILIEPSCPQSLPQRGAAASSPACARADNKNVAWRVGKRDLDGVGHEDAPVQKTFPVTENG